MRCPSSAWVIVATFAIATRARAQDDWSLTRHGVPPAAHARAEPTAALVARSSLLFERGDLEGAMAGWHQAADRGGDRGRRLAARAFAEHGFTDEAVSTWRQVLAARPGDVEAEVEIAALVEASNDPERAAAAWLELANETRADPSIRENARTHVVASWAQAHRLDAEIAAREDRVATPDDALLLVQALRRRDGAASFAVREALDHALQHHPDDVGLLTALSRWGLEAGDDRARGFALEHLVDVDPGNRAEHIATLIEAARSHRDDHTAAEMAERAAHDRAPGALVTTAELALARGDTAMARTSYETALAREPSDGRAGLALGALALARGDRSEALRSLRRVVSSRANPALREESVRELAAASIDAGRPLDVEPLIRSEMIAGRTDARAWLDLVASSGTDGSGMARELVDALASADPATSAIARRLSCAPSCELVRANLPHGVAVAALVALAARPDLRLEVRRAAVLLAGAKAGPLDGRLFAPALSDSHPAVRSAAAWVVARIGAFALLADHADDSDEATASFTLLGLARSSEGLARALVERHANDPRRSLRAAAMLGLGSVDANDETSPARTIAAARDRTDLVGLVALAVLGADRTLVARTVLVDAMMDASEERRAVARRALCAPLDLEAILERVPRDDDTFETFLTRALVEPPAPDLGTCGPLADALALAVRDRLSGSHERIVEALDVLARPDDLLAPSVTPALSRVLPDLVAVSGDPDPRVRALVGRVLARAQSPDGYATLVALATDPEDDVACATLEAMADGAPVPFTIVAPVTDAVVHRRSWRTRLAMVKLLARGPQDVLVALFSREPVALVRLEIARALQAIGSEALARIADAARSDPDPLVRTVALGSPSR